MAFAPKLDTANFVRSAEVVAVAILTEPPSLAGCLTGLSARGLRTVALAIFGPWIGNEKLGATTAFTSRLRAGHRALHFEEAPPGRKRKRTTRRRSNRKKEEEL
jgi:hypothetical protein